MHVYRAAKGGLRQDTFHLGIGPVSGPIIEKLFLTRAEQLQAGQIDFIRIVFRIVDVIGARAHLGNLARGASLEFAILKNGEVYAADIQPRKVHANATIDRLCIHRIRQA